MKNVYSGWRFIGLFVCLLSIINVQAQSYHTLWQQVKQAQDNGLPKTVIQYAQRIVDKATTEHNVPQLLKATLCKDAFQIQLTPDSLYTSLTQLEHWYTSETDSVHRAILASLLADCYLQVLQQDEWSVRQRTELDATAVPTDVRLWTYQLFANKIDSLCRASIRPVHQLLYTSTQSFQPFVTLQAGSRFYGHDLFHLLSLRALQFYRKLWGNEVDTLQQTGITYIYKQMQQAYQHRSDAEDAALYTTLEQLHWQYEQAQAKAQNMPEEQAAVHRYLIQLDSLRVRYAHRPLCAEVYIRQATCLSQTPTASLQTCLQICEEGLKRYPKSARVNELRNIRERIYQPQLTLTTPSEAYPNDSVQIKLSYRNVHQLQLQLYATTYTELPYGEEAQQDRSAEKHESLIQTYSWQLRPAPHEGHSPVEWIFLQSDTVLQIKVPANNGIYRLCWRTQGVKMQQTFLSVSQLKVLLLPVGDGAYEWTVVDANTGHPVSHATVSCYSSHSYYNHRSSQLVQEVQTNAHGKVKLPHDASIHYYQVHTDTDFALLPQSIFMEQPVVSNDSLQHKVLLLTDRTAYRPGQTVYVKGIVYQQNKQQTQVTSNENYELRLLDANRQELATQTVCSNAYGSFSTTFVLPNATLNGVYTLQMCDRSAEVSIRVEAYKRPTFAIHIQPVQQAYHWGDTLQLKGWVASFNGSAVQHCPLIYQVRQSSIWQRFNRSQPLLTDTVRLDKQGNFTLSLPLHPTQSSVQKELVRVNIWVTDERGETQTADYTFPVQKQSYKCTIAIPTVICKEDTLHYTCQVTNGVGVWQSVQCKGRLFQVSTGKMVWEDSFTANQPMDLSAWKQLPSQRYRWEWCIVDSQGREEQCCATATRQENTFYLYSQHDTRPSDEIPWFCLSQQSQFDATHPAVLWLGTSYQDVYLMMDVFRAQQRIESRILHLNDTICRMELPYQAQYGEGITLSLAFVKQGKLWSQHIALHKLQSATNLQLHWQVFRDKLRSGQDETWKLSIRDTHGSPVSAELLASMYDASLDDLFTSNQWPSVVHPSSYHPVYYQTSVWGNSYCSFPFHLLTWRIPQWTFDSFYQPPFYRKEMLWNTSRGVHITGVVPMPQFKESGNIMSDAADEHLESTVEHAVQSTNSAILQPAETLPALRTQFAETAFFYPHLQTNPQGEVSIQFTLPQSLTRWHFRGYAHTTAMQTGQIEAYPVSSKEFMLTPNLPRFVRVGDQTTLTAAVTNLTQHALHTKITLSLFDPMTHRIIHTDCCVVQVAAGQKETAQFTWQVPRSQYTLLGVRMIAEGGHFSDGEQQLLPLLSNEEWITESLPFEVSGNQPRQIPLDRLFNGNSRQVTDAKFTIECAGNPMWYAIRALPTLSQPMSDNAIDWATAYYAQTLAGYIAHRFPQLATAITHWKQLDPEQLQSSLEKNQSLKEVLLTETPWVLDSQDETRQLSQLSSLFQPNQLKSSLLSAFSKLASLQCEDGAWSWYSGMASNRFVTTYIARLFVRLPLLTGQPLSSQARVMCQRALDYLHRQVLEEYRQNQQKLLSDHRSANLSHESMEYLYLIALSGEQVPGDVQPAYQALFSRMEKQLPDMDILSKAQAIVILQRAGKQKEARRFVASLLEHLTYDTEQGAYFAFNETDANWNMHPIQIQVAVMEALQCCSGYESTLNLMKRWLLNQKQTRSWHTPVATADAVYALLCQDHTEWNQSGDVTLTFGKQILHTGTDSSVAGIDYLKRTYPIDILHSQASYLNVEKQGAGMAWGAVYAQYRIPVSQVKKHTTALSVEKHLYLEQIISGKEPLTPVQPGTTLKVGDKLVVRLVLRVDRSMDFVQLKDARSACLDPIGSRSGYAWLGTASYVELKDAATYYYFDHLDKGVYIIEDQHRIARSGKYETGLATAQCYYAPQYTAHSEGSIVEVK